MTSAIDDPVIRAIDLGEMTVDAAQAIASGEATATAEGRANTGRLLEMLIGRRKPGRHPAKRTIADQQGEARHLHRYLGLSIQEIASRLPNLTSAQIDAAIGKSANDRITTAAKSYAEKK